jgi:hypothetical protein
MQRLPQIPHLKALRAISRLANRRNGDEADAALTRSLKD